MLSVINLPFRWLAGRTITGSTGSIWIWRRERALNRCIEYTESKKTQGRKHSWALGDYSVLGASGLSGLPIAEG
jgi:hypothetical protein